VLLEVGEAELVRRLVAAADPDEQKEGHDVGRAVFLDDQAQAVPEHLTRRGREALLVGRRGLERALGGAPGEPR